MKKVFGLFLSLIVLAGLWSCEAELPDEPQKPNPDEPSYLTFVSSGESSVTLVKVGKPFDISLEYSLDGKNWNPYTIGETIYLLEDKLSFRAGEQGNRRLSKGIDDYYQFVFSGEIAARGSILSLLDRSCRKNVIPNYAFFNLFRDCTGLTKAPELPATNLAERCYWGMFSGCTSLNEAPELPAMKLAEECYYCMFDGCTGLTKAPELPATELAEHCYSGMFNGCTNLTEAPELPATELAGGCYSNMFNSCTSLTKAPEFPAMKLAEECYYYMFWGCTDLTEAPVLPATELAGLCYCGMFWGCTSLTKAPELPAMKLVGGCYSNIFNSCTSLTEAPELPAMELAEECYSGMFYGCTNLTKALELPAMELAGGCYSNMFNSCTSLTKAPELPAIKLAEGCYSHMFSSCTNLNYIKALFTDEPSKETTSGWLSNVASTGTFIKSKDATWDVRGDNGIPEGWTVESDAGTSDDPQKPNPDEPSYLTFVSSGWSSVTLVKVGKPYEITLEYSMDGEVWEPYAIGETVKLADGGELMFRAGEEGNANFSAGLNNYYKFRFSGEIAAKGSIMSLLDRSCRKNTVPRDAFSGLFMYCNSLTSAPTLPATELGGCCYYCMFRDCTSLTKAPELPATELDVRCYSWMFSGCTNLTDASELPATKLAEECYSWMFSGCTNLIDAPELPATKLAERCYWGIFSGCANLTESPELPAMELARYCYYCMFDGCTGLTKAPALPATELAHGCYNSMFWGCTSLTEAPALPATKLSEGCYFNLFEGCTSLTEAPELPATVLAEHCYLGMFSGCTSLTKALALPATVLAYGCYNSMFEGCTSLTEAPELPATELAYGCYSSMFLGCTSLTKAPALPARKLAEGCYKQMFEGCRNLKFVKALLTDKPSEETTKNWLSGVSPTGTFVKNKYAKWDVRGSSGIPEGWTIENDAGTSDDPQKPNPDEPSYLTFVSSGWSSVTLVKVGKPYEITLEYSMDGEVWEPYTIGETVKLADGGELMFRAGEEGNANFSAGLNNYYQFRFSGEIAAKGSIMSLLDRNCRKNAVPSYAFKYLFRDCAGLMEAPELPAAELESDCYNSMFYGCTNLTEAPELPATKLGEKCYYCMFRGCTNLTEAPDLPATELAEWCYDCMFLGCTSLTKAPDLPATNLVAGCYSNMFDSCTSLTEVPALPARELAYGCYFCMFDSCTSLTEAPELPARELVGSCYYGMFSGCTNLTEVPDLPARELAVSCYKQMFEGCKNLTKAPDLPAIDLDNGCYSHMFSGCTNLNYIKALFTDEPSKETTSGWLSNVASTGTFVKSKDATWDVRGDNGIPEGWTVESDAGTSDDPQKPNPDEPSYLTFVSSGESTVTLVKVGEPFDIFISLEYSLDGTNWKPYTIGETISLLDGEKLMFRAGIVRNKFFSHSYDRYYKFIIFGSVAAKGNIMSLLNRKCNSKSILSYTFFNLFSDCTGLTSAPDLPAAELAEHCYQNMFRGCTSLTKAPTLPATELAAWCYFGMFYGCTSLNYIKALFTDKPSRETTGNWLSGVAPTGTFVKSKDATWDVMGVSGVPEGWTVITE